MNLKGKCEEKNDSVFFWFFFFAHVPLENFTRLLEMLPLLPHLGFPFPFSKASQSFWASRRE